MTMITALLAITVLLLDAGAVGLYFWSIGLIKTIEHQRDAYRLVAVSACQELKETQDLLVAMAEDSRKADAKKSKAAINRKWD